MSEDNCSRVSSSECDSFTAKQRKRRKWDQPDESLISSYVLANIGSLAGIAIPTSVSSNSVAPFSTSGAISPQLIQVPLQHTAAIVQNLVQSRIQDELISREIIINDADSAIRYKLTKRQMQEEIQKCTGAVVITRGKYRPPNAPLDGERPLHLHMSAASHFETTAERIKAVDQAAAMIEELLKQGSVCNGVKVDRLLSTCVFLGFEADPSLNIASRIRGPNDQYINHIMNETGATVSLRGLGSGHSENEPTEEAQQPLHLLLSSDDSRSLEHAKLLADNLLDTISIECGASRVLSCNKYSAVPPPSQLQAGLLSPFNLPTGSTAHGGVSIVDTKPPISLSSGVTNPGISQIRTSCYPHTSLSNGTSYIGYGGIYPQVTPLQQVALALRQSTSPVTSTAAPIATAASKESPLEVSLSLKDKRPQKRKFQESPASAKGPASTKKNLQGSEFPMPRELTSHVGASNTSAMPPPPKKCVQQSFGGMPPPPPPPKFDSIPKLHSNNPPLPKFNSNSEPNGSNTVLLASKPEAVPDTLIKLMEYGDGDDDDDDGDDADETAGNPLKNHSSAATLSKPFWAV